MIKTPKVILTIGASDSSSGGGMQADLRTIHSLDAYGVAAVTAVTAQNTMAVNKLIPILPEMIANQIGAIFDDFNIHAIKIGVLNNNKTIDVIAYILQNIVKHKIPVILDPAMVTKTNYQLLEPEAIPNLVAKLFPLSDIVTPNLTEAQLLTQVKINNVADAKIAAKILMEMQAPSVLIKTIKTGDDCIDLYYDGKEFITFSMPLLSSYNDHGAGCTLSSAMATFLAQGKSMPEAIALAKTYLSTILNETIQIGHGHGPMDHFGTWSHTIECDIKKEL